MCGKTSDKGQDWLKSLVDILGGNNLLEDLENDIEISSTSDWGELSVLGVADGFQSFDGSGANLAGGFVGEGVGGSEDSLVKFGNEESDVSWVSDDTAHVVGDECALASDFGGFFTFETTLQDGGHQSQY